MKRRSQRGVTLMELLIAVTLLSLVVAGVLMSMRVGLNAMQRSNQRFIANRKVLGTQRLLEQQVAGLMPVPAVCVAGNPGAPRGTIQFFQGATQTMRFVSSYSLGEGARGAPKIVELQVIAGEQGRGVRLVVNEHPYTGPLGAGLFCLGMIPDPATGINAPAFVPVVVGPGSFVLADKLAECRFFFRETLPDPPFERWLPRWVREADLPSAIRVEMTPLEADSSTITPVSLTAPIHVRKAPVSYVD